MKMLEKLQKRLQNGKKDNKGFSLVELIIVIAIMAILVGIVGTQVIPYLNKSREAKDVQILDSFSTAAVSAYSMNAESTEFAAAQTSSPAGSVTVSLKNDSTDWTKGIWSLTSYKTIADVKAAMSSPVGKKIDDISIKIDFATNTLTVTASDGTNPILEVVTSHI